MFETSLVYTEAGLIIAVVSGAIGLMAYLFGRNDPTRSVIRREREAGKEAGKKELAMHYIATGTGLWSCVRKGEGKNSGPMGICDMPWMLLENKDGVRLLFSTPKGTEIGTNFRLRFRKPEESPSMWFEPFDQLLIAEKIK